MLAMQVMLIHVEASQVTSSLSYGGPVSWQSRMQTSVALSSMEAEYMAASAATQEAMWQARLLVTDGYAHRLANQTCL